MSVRRQVHRLGGRTLMPPYAWILLLAVAFSVRIVVRHRLIGKWRDGSAPTTEDKWVLAAVSFAPLFIIACAVALTSSFPANLILFVILTLVGAMMTGLFMAAVVPAAHHPPADRR